MSELADDARHPAASPDHHATHAVLDAGDLAHHLAHHRIATGRPDRAAAILERAIAVIEPDNEALYAQQPHTSTPTTADPTSPAAPSAPWFWRHSVLHVQYCIGWPGVPC